MGRWGMVSLQMLADRFLWEGWGTWRGGEGEVFVDEGYGHAAFSDAAGDALDGAVTDVAGAEDSGDAGFEGEGLAVEGPGVDVAASADVAVGVAFERGWQPVGFGDGTNHDEQGDGVTSDGGFRGVGWARDGGDLLEVDLAMDRGDVGIGLDADVGLVVDLLDEVLRHGLGETGSSNDHDDFRGVAGVEDGGLAGGVTSPDDEDATAGDGDSVEAGGTVEDTSAEEFVVSGEFEAMPGDSGGEEEDGGGEAISSVEGDAVASVECLDFFYVALDEHLDTEMFDLLEGSLGELVSGDSGREAEVVFDARGGSGLAAGSEAFDEQDAEALGRAGDGGCHAGGTSSGDDDVVVPAVGDSLESEGFGDAADGGVFEGSSVDGDGRLGFGICHDRGPVELDSIGGEKGADGAAGGVVLGAGDGGPCGGRVTSHVLGHADA